MSFGPCEAADEALLAMMESLRQVAFCDTFSDTVCHEAQLVGRLPPAAHGGAHGLRFRMPVAKALANRFGKLHGGAASTVVDVLTSYCLCMLEPDRLAHVSTHLAIDFLNPMPTGAALIADCIVLRAGRTLAVMECELRREEDGVLVVKGSHTKAFVPMPVSQL